MAVEVSAIAERLEHSGATPSLARAIATELRDAIRSEAVTREYLDLALGKLRAELERDNAGLRAELERDIAALRADTQRDNASLRIDMERLLREQTNKLIGWIAAIVGLSVTIVGGLGVLF